MNEIAKPGHPPHTTQVGFTPAFVEHLNRSFNEPQRRAIQWTAATTVADYWAEDAENGGGGKKGKGRGRKKKEERGEGLLTGVPWPFTIVQGPPGTGKTHTVWGILNTLHLAAYQRYYRNLLKTRVFAPLRPSRPRPIEPKLCFALRCVVCSPGRARRSA